MAPIIEVTGVLAQAQQADAVDWVARAIAIAGASAGFIALAWNIWVYSTNRPRLRVHGGVYKLISVGASTTSPDEWLIADVVNQGRQPAFIDAVQVILGRRPPVRRLFEHRRRVRRTIDRAKRTRTTKLLFPLPLEPGSLSQMMSPGLPKRLEPGERARFMLVDLTEDDGAAMRAMKTEKNKVWIVFYAPGANGRARVSLAEQSAPARITGS